MLRVPTLPGSLKRVLEAFRPCFTAPTFLTFVSLLAGMIAPTGKQARLARPAVTRVEGEWGQLPG
jgi:hypothetical protein